jgi:hypothetical protein
MVWFAATELKVFVPFAAAVESLTPSTYTESTEYPLFGVMVKTMEPFTGTTLGPEGLIDPLAPAEAVI